MGPELYDPQRTLPARIEIPAWPRAELHESMRDYARRLAATIEPGDDLYVGGMSFGAMLALEIASMLTPRPRGVFLIAGARDGRALSPIVRMTCRVAVRMPEPLSAAAFRAAPLLVRMVGRPDRAQRLVLVELARRSLPWLTRWGCSAMRDWTAPRSEEIGCPVHHIHGGADRMIPLSRVRPPPDRVIPDGGHVIHLTHADQVNAFISERLLV